MLPCLLEVFDGLETLPDGLDVFVGLLIEPLLPPFVTGLPPDIEPFVEDGLRLTDA